MTFSWLHRSEQKLSKTAERMTRSQLSFFVRKIFDVVLNAISLKLFSRTSASGDDYDLVHSAWAFLNR